MSQPGPGLPVVLAGEREVNPGHCSVGLAPGAAQAYKTSRFGRGGPEEAFGLWEGASQGLRSFHTVSGSTLKKECNIILS